MSCSLRLKNSVTLKEKLLPFRDLEVPVTSCSFLHVVVKGSFQKTTVTQLIWISVPLACGSCWKPEDFLPPPKMVFIGGYFIGTICCTLLILNMFSIIRFLWTCKGRVPWYWRVERRTFVYKYLLFFKGKGKFVCTFFPHLKATAPEQCCVMFVAV